MANEKISRALESATTHLKNSMVALNKKDESSFADSLWHTAAELEYALFLFSILFPEESEVSRLKPNPDLKKMGTGSILIEVSKLLNEAEKFVVNESLLDAYRSVYVARNCILRVQEDIAKKKREALRKKA